MQRGIRSHLRRFRIDFVAINTIQIAAMGGLHVDHQGAMTAEYATRQHSGCQFCPVSQVVAGAKSRAALRVSWYVGRQARIIEQRKCSARYYGQAMHGSSLTG